MDYSALQSTATRLIKSFGASCKVVTVDGKSISASIVFLPVEKADSNETYQTSADKMALMSHSTIQPKPGDQVTVGKDVSVVVTSESFAPAGSTNLFYKLGLKS